MTSPKPKPRLKSVSTCAVCTHPERKKIDALLLAGTYTASEIRHFLEELDPSLPHPLPSDFSFSRHRHRHALIPPDGSFALPVLLDGRMYAPLNASPAETLAIINVKAAIPKPEDRVSIAEAAAVVLNLALENALRHPEKVSLKDAALFADLIRKMGMQGSEDNDFAEAWAELEKTKRRRKRTTRVKITEVEESSEEEEPGTPPDILEAEAWGSEEEEEEG